MAKEIIRVLVLLISLGVMGNCQAILLDRGNGMVYDTDQDLTWLKDTNIAGSLGYADDGKLHAYQVMDFVDNFEYASYNDWRLPEFDLQACYDSPTYSDEFQCLTQDTSAGEAAFMFKEVLGNNFWMDTDSPSSSCIGLGSSSDGCLVNTEADGVAFENLIPDFYWVRTINAQPWQAYSFYTRDGSHYESHDEFATAYAWLVRSGDVASIPEPDMLLLLAAGLVVVVVAKRKQHNSFATDQYV